MNEYDEEYDDDVVRCPQCGAIAEDSWFFADDDVDEEQPYCECGYVWPVAVDIHLVDFLVDDDYDDEAPIGFFYGDTQ